MENVKKSSEHRSNISNGRKGMRFSEEHINNLKKSKTKKIKEIYENGTIKIWNNAKELADNYNTTVSSVRRAVYNCKSETLKNKYFYINN
jgi:hypothetical protein